MIDTVVQNEDMLYSRIIDKSNLDSAFLKTRTSPICSRKAFVSLSNGTLEKFLNVITYMASGWVITNKENWVRIKMNLHVQLLWVDICKWCSEIKCICSLGNAKDVSLRSTDDDVSLGGAKDACISLGRTRDHLRWTFRDASLRRTIMNIESMTCHDGQNPKNTQCGKKHQKQWYESTMWCLGLCFAKKFGTERQTKTMLSALRMCGFGDFSGDAIFRWWTTGSLVDTCQMYLVILEHANSWVISLNGKDFWMIRQINPNLTMAYTPCPLWHRLQLFAPARTSVVIVISN